MYSVNEMEAIAITTGRVEELERRRPWLREEAEIQDDHRRSKLDLFFHSIQRYLEESRVEPLDLA